MLGSMVNSSRSDATTFNYSKCLRGILIPSSMQIDLQHLFTMSPSSLCFLWVMDWIFCQWMCLLCIVQCFDKVFLHNWKAWLTQQTKYQSDVKVTRDGKEPEPWKNELHQNPGFAKNQTEPEVKNVQEPELNWTLLHKQLNRTRAQMSWFFLGSFTEWNCWCILTCRSKQGILLYLG